jgi:serine/threonine-protein kinase HipA
VGQRPGADIALLRAVGADGAAWHPAGRGRGRWSLAGAQAKIALAHDEMSGMWGIPSGRIPTTHILKPAIAGLDHHDLNEHLCLTAAGRLGLRVAHTRIHRFAGETSLVVRRYDRVLRDRVVVRVHQEDCCQALGVHPDLKYQVDGGPGIEAIASLLDEVELRSARADIDALLRAAAFNWLILGTDAHAKNSSLLLSGRQVRLAPLYDIASAAPFEHPKKLKIAQKIGGEYRPTAISRRHWERLTRTVGADTETLLTGIVDMAVRLPDVLSTVIEGVELADPERSVAHQLLDSVSAWTGSCLTALSKAPQ